MGYFAVGATPAWQRNGGESHVALYTKNLVYSQCGSQDKKYASRKLARFELCPGLLEIRFYAERGIPAFAYGPGLLTVPHGPNEFVPIDRIVPCAEVYALTAAELVHISRTAN